MAAETKAEAKVEPKAEPRPARAPAVVSIINHGVRIHQLGPDCTLSVGLNPAVPASLWAKFKRTPVVEHYLKLGKRGGFTVKRKPVNLALMRDQEALDAVDDTWDRDALRAWRTSEKRPAVAKAIDERLEDIVVVDEQPAGEDDEGKPRKGAKAKAEAAGAEFVEPEPDEQ